MTDRWQVCPVCHGRGEVNPALYGQMTTSTAWFTTCRTCGGATILDTLSGRPPTPIEQPAGTPDRTGEEA